MREPQTALVVAAHPDDDILGCGGVMARHVEQGDSVYVVFMADGVGSRGTTELHTPELKERQRAAEQAANIVGAEKPLFLGLPDNCLDTVPLLQVIKPLESLIEELHPNIIYTHHGGDLNIDHRITHQAVLTACRPQPGCMVKQIYSFEVLSSTEWASTHGGDFFIPQYYVDISNYLSIKIKALQAYDMEMRDYPHSRSISGVEALATYRGVSVGCKAAEAFSVERIITK